MARNARPHLAFIKTIAIVATNMHTPLNISHNKHQEQRRRNTHHTIVKGDIITNSNTKLVERMGLPDAAVTEAPSGAQTGTTKIGCASPEKKVIFMKPSRPTSDSPVNAVPRGEVLMQQAAFSRR